MVLYNIPLLMVLAFLGLTLIVGLYCTPRATTLRAYAVGNKRLHTTTLMVTVLATVFGGGALMREVPKIYDIGISNIAILFIYTVSLWIISLLGLRMGPFMDHLSVAETMGNVYGKYPRAITAILGICCSIGFVSIQINVMSSAIGMCIDSIDPRLMTVLSTLILIAYAAPGGVRAVTVTDILQFVTFIIIIPLIIRFLFVQTGKSFLEVVSLLQRQEKFQLNTLFQFDSSLLKTVGHWLWYTFFISPPVLQRLYMSSGPIQAYKVFLRVTFFSIIIIGCIILISLLIFVKDLTLSVTAIWPYILTSMPPAYKGCVAISLLGLTMSTTDSNLHLAAIMIGHDIVEIVQGTKAAPYMHQLRLMKLSTLVLGLLAMIITVYYPDLFELTHFVTNTLTPFFFITVIPPFILAIFGFRGSERTALIGMAISILINIALKLWLEPNIEIYFGILPMIANGLAIMAAHYLLPQPAGKGWIGTNDQQKRIKQLMRAFRKYKNNIDLE